MQVYIAGVGPPETVRVYIYSPEEQKLSMWTSDSSQTPTSPDSHVYQKFWHYQHRSRSLNRGGSSMPSDLHLQPQCICGNISQNVLAEQGGRLCQHGRGTLEKATVKFLKAYHWLMTNSVNMYDLVKHFPHKPIVLKKRTRCSSWIWWLCNISDLNVSWKNIYAFPLHTGQSDAPIFCKTQPSPLWSVCRRLPAAALKIQPFDSSVNPPCLPTS